MHDNRRENHDLVNDGPLEPDSGHEALPMAAAPISAAATTDHAGVEDQLRAQEAFYRNIVEGAADVTTLLAPDGTILYASATMTDRNSLGYAPHEVIGRNTLDIIHPDERAAVAHAITRDLAGHPTTVEARARKRDGTWMWAEMRGKAIVGLDGSTMIVAYSRNISDRKRLQERMKKSEEYYKSLLRGSSDLVTVIDESGALVFASDSVQKILGYRLDEVIGQPIFSYFHPDDLALATKRFTEVSDSNSSLTELRVRRKDGTWCPCEGTGRSVTSPDGRKLVLIVTRDISERKRVDREHALLAAIVESSDDAIVSNSLDQRITTWNKGAKRLFGYTAEEAIGQHASLYMPPEWRAWGEVFLDDLKTRIDHVQSFEVPCMRKDGRRVDVWTVCGGIRDRDGKLIGISAIHRDLTDRKRADREQALLAALVNSSEDAIISHSIDFRITSWNRGAQRLLGYSAQEAMGKRPFDLYIPPVDRAADQARLIHDLAMIREDPEAMRQFEMPVMRKDGTVLDTTVVGCGIHNSNGKLIGLSTIMRDVTQRKRAERESAALAAIVESSDDAINSVSPDLRITYWNHGAEKMFGFTSAEAIGQPLTLFIPPDHHQNAREIIELLKTHPEQVVRFEGPNRRKDGTLLDVSTVCFAIRDPEGQVSAITAIQRDVTERKRAEREVASLAAIVNASHDVIMNVSSEARILSWNPAAESAYGYTAAEAIGKGIEIFVPPDELQETMERTRRVVELGQPASWEQHARKGDGTPFINAVQIFPIRDELGNITGVAGIGRDITALKETERELVAAREAALAASQAKSEFLSSMSHEIRTPMTAILGMAELLGEGELNAEQRRYIEILGNNGRALLELINSILDLAKIESGRLTLEHVGFDLIEVVEKSAQTLAIRAHAKGLELIISFAPDVPTELVGDPLRLRQVLINLIGNAIKFTEQGEVLVSVDRVSASNDPLRLKFSVRDTGIGIAKDKLPALFAAFSQADSSTARKYGGSGLGLAIVKRLVNLMQGEVTLESELGKGSVFNFASPFETGAPTSVNWPDLTQVPVLVVEGNQTGSAALLQLLSAHGASVTEASSNEAALTATRQAVSAGRPIRIVLLDDRIASSDPHTLGQLIVEASSCGASILATIHCDNLAADIARLKSLKLETYLIKPIDIHELVKVIRHVIVGDCVDVSQDHPSLARETRLLPIIDRPLRILFADDSTDNRTLVRAFLKKTPYHLDEVENGRQAIDGFIAAGNYDLVLMDIQMPEVDGYAATRAIREWEREHSRARTPIIALTASVFNEAIRLTRAAGCDEHVGKPISKATLLRAIYDAVQAAQPTTNVQGAKAD
jgi:two-component system, sensor histidine kinase and response regulator